MFFRKKIGSTSVRRHKVSLNLDFDKKRGDFLKQKNVTRVGNSLLSTVGFRKSPYNVGISRTIARIGDYLVAMTAAKGIYTFNATEPAVSLIEVKDDIISHVKYQDKLVLSCVKGTYSTTNGMFVEQMTTAYFPSLAVCYDRIFGVNGYDLSMTAAGDITQWDDTLKITAHTKLDAVVALDKLYVLGDTCYTLTPDAEEIDMKFVPFGYGIGDVQTESVVTFGKRAIFASSNGLYELKSTAITPIFTYLNDYVSFDGCVACAYKGKYYVTCKRKDGELTCNDVMLVLDVNSEQICSVMNVQMQHINAAEGSFYAVSDCVLYYMSEEEQVESTYCQTVDFKSTDVKYLDKLTLRSYTDVDVWVNGNGEKRRYSVQGKCGIQSIPLAGSGRQFDVVVHAPNGLQLDMLELSARTYEV